MDVVTTQCLPSVGLFDPIIWFSQFFRNRIQHRAESMFLGTCECAMLRLAGGDLPEARKHPLFPLFARSPVCCPSSLARNDHHFGRFLTVHSSHSMSLDNPAVIPHYISSATATPHEYVLLFFLSVHPSHPPPLHSEKSSMPAGDVHHQENRRWGFAWVAGYYLVTASRYPIGRGWQSKTYSRGGNKAYLGVIST